MAEGQRSMPYETYPSPPSSPSATIPAFRDASWHGHSQSAPPKTGAPDQARTLRPGAVGRLAAQLEQRIAKQRSSSVEPCRPSAGSKARTAQEFWERLDSTHRNRTQSPPPSPSRARRAASPLKRDSRITDVQSCNGLYPTEVFLPSAAKFAASPSAPSPRPLLVPLTVSPKLAARFDTAHLRGSWPASPAASARAPAQRCADRPASPSAALREIEDAMRNIEAAVSLAEDPCMLFNTSWDPNYPSEQERGASSDAAVGSQQDKPQALGDIQLSGKTTAKELFPVSEGAAGGQQDLGHVDGDTMALADSPLHAESAEEHAPPPDVLHAVSPLRAAAASMDSTGNEEWAFPQTPSSLQGCNWGSKLWPSPSVSVHATTAAVVEGAAAAERHAEAEGVAEAEGATDAAAEGATDAEPKEAVSPVVVTADSCAQVADSQGPQEEVQEPMIRSQGASDAQEHATAAQQQDSREPADEGRRSMRSIALVALCMAAIVTAVIVSVCLGMGPAALHLMNSGRASSSQPRGHLILPNSHRPSGMDAGETLETTSEHANDKALAVFAPRHGGGGLHIAEQLQAHLATALQHIVPAPGQQPHRALLGLLLSLRGGQWQWRMGPCAAVLATLLCLYCGACLRRSLRVWRCTNPNCARRGRGSRRMSMARDSLCLRCGVWAMRHQGGMWGVPTGRTAWWQRMPAGRRLMCLLRDAGLSRAAN